MRLFPWIFPLAFFALGALGCSQPPPTPVYLSLDGIGSAEETNLYYQSMTDRPPEATLAEWKKSRCFPDDFPDAKDPNRPNIPNEVFKAFYYNPSDLGLGREMRCAVCPDDSKINPGLISCAVSNHGPKDGPTLGIATLARLKAKGAPDTVVSDGERKKIRRDVIRESLTILDNFLSPIKGAPKIFRGQTVAMDFDRGRLEPNDRVRFYIYDAESPAALIAPNTVPTGLIPGLALDNEGVKFMRNCTYCHGGIFDPKSNKIRGSSFLDFNLAYLNYGDSPELLNSNETSLEFSKNTKFTDATAPIDVKTGLPLDNQNRLASLNTLVNQTLSSSKLAPAIADRINKSIYLVDGNEPTGVSTNYIPAAAPVDPPAHPLPAWTDDDKKDLFVKVVRPYCATCHFSQSATFNLRPADDNATPLTFRTPDDWFKRKGIQAAIQKSVCASGDMPHAEVTRLNLLADPVAFGKLCQSVSSVH